MEFKEYAKMTGFCSAGHVQYIIASTINNFIMNKGSSDKNNY